MTHSNSILFTDPAFNTSSSSICDLILRLSKDSISYAVIDSNNKVVVLFDEQECDDIPQALAKKIETDTYLGLSYQQVNVSIYTEDELNVPNELFDDNKLLLNRGFITSSIAKSLRSGSYPGSESTSVFAINPVLQALIDESFPAARQCSYYVALAPREIQDRPNTLIFDFTADSFSVQYKKNGPTLFQQTFSIDNIDELNYYVLLVRNMLSIDVDTTAVWICGIINPEDEKYNCLNGYFSHLQFLNVEGTALDIELLENMPAYYYTSLLTVHKCE